MVCRFACSLHTSCACLAAKCTACFCFPSTNDDTSFDAPLLSVLCISMLPFGWHAPRCNPTYQRHILEHLLAGLP
uniref:Putative secreted protein n=1 Tax=Ixodes ricinus TaxID=34613 RepID=A0A6B0TZC8_IXORI